MKTESKYTFSNWFIIDLPKESILAISMASSLCQRYNPRLDLNLDNAIHKLIDEKSDMFAAIAKKKGFERSSTGLSAIVDMHPSDDENGKPTKIGVTLTLDMKLIENFASKPMKENT